MLHAAGNYNTDLTDQQWQFLQPYLSQLST